ncbi:transposase [Yokenella regensburgei]|uniref:transposase n=1 Tax=Yokenella regensburgei TaxID=158877 RepID=UPI001432EC89|nr:transposase [Yokenella regensburgei]
MVARIARAHGSNNKQLFRWKNQYGNRLLDDDDIQKYQPVLVVLTVTSEPVMSVSETNQMRVLLKSLQRLHDVNCT